MDIVEELKISDLNNNTKRWYSCSSTLQTEKCMDIRIKLNNNYYSKTAYPSTSFPISARSSLSKDISR